MRRNYNEFRDKDGCPNCDGEGVIAGIGGREITCQRRWMGWRDYFNFSIMDFSIILVRKYIWYDADSTTMMVQVFGMSIYNKVKAWPESKPQYPVDQPGVDHA